MNEKHVHAEGEPSHNDKSHNEKNFSYKVVKHSYNSFIN